MDSQIVKVNDVSLYCILEPAKEPKGTALLFHGYSFTSDVWKDIGLIKELSKAGFSVFAIDMPGFKVSRSFPSVDEDAFYGILSRILDHKVEEIPIIKNKLIIMLGASASCYYLLGFAQRHSKKVDALVLNGTITTDLKELKTELISAKILAIWGDRDTYVDPREAERFIKKIKDSETAIIHGGHSCYLEHPAEFNKMVVDFLKKQVEK